MINPEFLITLKALPQWVCWKYEVVNERKTKVPYQITGYKAASDNPRSWTTYQNVTRSNGFDGIGIMFADGLCGIDLDHHSDGQNDYINNDGSLTAGAQEWITAIPTYWEVSPSKQGLHALCFGSLPEGRRQDDRQGAAFYDTHRFFTVTGLHVEGTPADAAHCHDELTMMYRWLFGDNPQSATATPVSYDMPVPDTTLDASIIAMLQRDDRYARLWGCDFTDYAGDHSAADLALAGRIMRAVSNNAAWADRIMRQWQGIRAKWDVRHFGNGDTYGQHTLKMAVANLDAPEEPQAVVERMVYGYGEIRSHLPARRVLTLQ